MTTDGGASRCDSGDGSRNSQGASQVTGGFFRGCENLGSIVLQLARLISGAQVSLEEHKHATISTRTHSMGSIQSELA